MGSRDSPPEPSLFKNACVNGFYQVPNQQGQEQHRYSCSVILALLVVNFPGPQGYRAWSRYEINECVTNPNKEPGSQKVLNAILALADWVNDGKLVDKNQGPLKAYADAREEYLTYCEFLEECERTGESGVFFPMGVRVMLFPDDYR